MSLCAERGKKGWIQLDYIRQDKLPGRTDLIRDNAGPLWCGVLELKPKLRLTLSEGLAHDSASSKNPWDVTVVWVHSMDHDNGDPYSGRLCSALEVGINLFKAQTKRCKVLSQVEVPIVSGKFQF